MDFDTLEDRRVLATLSVNADTDAALTFGEGVDDGTLTLREAIAIVNGSYTPAPGNPNGDVQQIVGDVGVPGDPDRIVFAENLFADGPATITLGRDAMGDPIPSLQGPSGQLTITESVIIAGPGFEQLTIDASGTDPDGLDNGNGSRIFELDSSISLNAELNLAITGLTLTGGDSDGNGGAIS